MRVFVYVCSTSTLDLIPESRKMTEQIDWRAKATTTSGLRLGILNGVEELETPTGCRHKAKDITPSVALRKEPWTEEALHNLL